MKKNIFFTAVIVISSIFISCATVTEVPQDKSAAQIIQMGQNAVSASDYKSALVCYNTVLQRYGSDASVYAEATYETGHVYLKQKKYAEAYETFTKLLSIYEFSPGALPPAYKKLANIGINQIPAKKLAELSKNTPEADSL